MSNIVSLTGRTSGLPVLSYSPLSVRTEAHDVSSIAVAPHSPSLVLAGVYFYSGNRGEVILSTDGGSTFVSVLQSPVPVNAVAIHPENPQIMFAGTGSFYAPVAPGGLFISTDGGASWSPTPLQNVVVNSIAVSRSDPDLIFAGCGGSDCRYAGIFKSPDGGATWHKIVNGLPAEYAITALQIDEAHDATLFAASFYGGIFVSLDRGNYWTQIGLSEYLVYDLAQIGGSDASAACRTSSAQQFIIPSATIVAGTTSGLYQYTAAGSGLISGSVTAEDSGSPVDAAHFSSSCGSTCESANGFYLLLVPAGVHTIDVAADGFHTERITGVQVPSGGSIVRDISLRPQGDSTSCPASALLADKARWKHLALLRIFRDSVLAATAEGRKLTACYYAYGPAFLNLLSRRQDLRKRCASLLLKCMPVLESARPGKTLQLPAPLARDISSLLQALEEASPAELGAAFAQLRSYLRDSIGLKIIQGG
jgi:hypothetical protein